MSVLKQNVNTATGDATGVGAGSVVSGNVVQMGNVGRRLVDLSALVNVTANTSGLTMSPKWKVSADNSTWYEVADQVNSAVVALATGASGGGDVNGQKVIPAPSAIKGWQYARMDVEIGGETGTTNDVYSIGYTYRQHRSGRNR